MTTPPSSGQTVNCNKSFAIHLTQMFSLSLPINKISLKICGQQPVASFVTLRCLCIKTAAASSEAHSHLHLCPAGDSKWLTVAAGVVDCYYNVTDLPPGGAFRFRVTCTNKAGQGPYSNCSGPVSLDPAGTLNGVTLPNCDYPAGHPIMFQNLKTLLSEFVIVFRRRRSFACCACCKDSPSST